MPMIFTTRPGAVIKLIDDSAIQCTTKFLGLGPNDITFEQQRSIVTRLTLGFQTNIQFLHSLGSLIYVYTFGDRMGQITLSGLSFPCVCPPGQSGAPGAEKMLMWYNDNRASRRSDPVRITLGSTVIEGFIIGLSEDVVDPATNLVQWGVTVASLPGDD